MELQRPTFEAVKTAQKRLKFEFFEQLIEKNDVLGKESRELFFDTASLACLGLEKSYQFTLGLDQESHATHSLGDLAIWLKLFLDFKATPDKKQEIYLQGKTYRIENKILWSSLMQSLYAPMSEALITALHSSAELMGREGGTLGLKSKEKIKVE